jgi:putative cobalt transporter subunit CbtB
MLAHVLAPEARPRVGRLLTALVGLFALYLVGLDNGGLLSIAQGDLAYTQNFIHEAVHDARHAAGFPCH